MPVITHKGGEPPWLPTPKDPNSVLDYQFDWVGWLSGDTIATSTWTVPAGLTLDSSTNTTTTTTAWLSGGTSNTTYLVTNRITTAGGRTEIRSMNLTVRNK